MMFELPRVNLHIKDARGIESHGEINLLSLGFGIHQAWIYAALFGTAPIFHVTGLLTVGARSFETAPITSYFVVSIVAFIAFLLFIGITDQRFLPFYTSKKVLRNAAIATSLGTFMAFATALPSPIGSIAALAGGVVTGIASALLLVFWGTAFSRDSSASIVLNSILAITIALSIYTTLIYAVPSPFSAILTALLPLVELPILQGKTPKSYVLRNEVPIFRPLPVKKGSFSVRFAMPILLAGFALGSLRSIATQIIIPTDTLSLHALTLVAAGIISVGILIVLLFFGAHRYWDSLFRCLVPLVMIAICFIPVSVTDNSIVASIVLLVGFICLESLMWIFFGQLSQTFRLSAAFIFGIGRGCLALGSLAGTFSVANTSLMDSLTPFGETSGMLLYLAALVLAYVAMPRVSDIKRMIDPSFEGRHNPFDELNDQAEELRRIVEDEEPVEEADLDCEADAQESEQADETPIPRCATPLHTEQKRASGSAMPAASEPATNEKAPSKTTRYRRQCEAIANRYLLSRRETEVLYLLAKGHNAAFIHKRLHIAQSTTKSHIHHIYQKLDIHTQQELLEMVSDAENE